MVDVGIVPGRCVGSRGVSRSSYARQSFVFAHNGSYHDSLLRQLNNKAPNRYFTDESGEQEKGFAVISQNGLSLDQCERRI